jgi:tetratricopeptide (TPR) repeat protein
MQNYTDVKMISRSLLPLCLLLGSLAFSIDSHYLATPGEKYSEEIRLESKDPNIPITRAIVSYYFDSGKINKAIEYLNDQVRISPDNAEAWRLRGLVYFRVRNLEFATADFKQAVALTEGFEKAINLYYLADSQARRGGIKEAMAILDELEFKPGFSKVARNAKKACHQGREFPKLEIDMKELNSSENELPSVSIGTHLVGKIVGGHDSNVLFLADINIIPGVTTSSWFTKPSIFVQQPLKRTGLTLEASSIYTHNLTKSAQTYDNIIASLGLDYRIMNPIAAKLGLRTYVSSDFTWYNLSGMKLLSIGQTVGLRAVPIRRKTGNISFNLPVTYLQYPKPKLAESIYDADGFVLSPSLTLRLSLLSTVFTGTLSAGKRYAKGSNQRSTSLGASLGFLKDQLPHRLSLEGNLELLRTLYPYSTLNRTDQTVSADLGLNVGLETMKSSLKLSAAHIRSYSTLTVGNYRKYVFSLGVTYEAL